MSRLPSKLQDVLLDRGIAVETVSGVTSLLCEIAKDCTADAKQTVHRHVEGTKTEIIDLLLQYGPELMDRIYVKIEKTPKVEKIFSAGVVVYALITHLRQKLRENNERYDLN